MFRDNEPKRLNPPLLHVDPDQRPGIRNPIEIKYHDLRPNISQIPESSPNSVNVLTAPVDQLLVFHKDRTKKPKPLAFNIYHPNETSDAFNLARSHINRSKRRKNPLDPTNCELVRKKFEEIHTVNSIYIPERTKR